MKALVKTAARPGSLEWTDWERPVAGPGEVVVAVEASGICGTDLSIYKWAEELAQQYHWPIPLVLGHEFSGRIAEVGPGVTGLAVGDRVSANPILHCGECWYCRRGTTELCDNRPGLGLHLPGAFAPFTKIRASNVVPIPDEVSFEVGALSEPLAVGIHALERARLQAGESVAVVGAGPIGLLIALAARHMGADPVFVTGLSRDAGRLALAAELGLHAVDAEKESAADVVKAATEGRGADVVMEAGGHPSAVLQSVSLARKGGRIGLVGLPHQATLLSTSALALQEKELIGCRSYRPATWSKIPGFLKAMKAELEQLITHRLPASQGVEAMQMALAGEGVKILLIP